jgi:hypothetical protein
MGPPPAEGEAPAKVGSARTAGASTGGARDERLTSPCATDPTFGECEAVCAAVGSDERESDETDPDNDDSEKEGASEEGVGSSEEDDGPSEEDDGPSEEDEEGPGDGAGPGDAGPGEEDGPGEEAVPEGDDNESNDDGDDSSAGDEAGGGNDGGNDGGKDGTCNPASASLVPVRVECIADPVTPDDADFATPSRSGSCPLTAAPPNSPSTSAPAPRSMSPYGLP